jgi:hypothetical protein
MAKLIEKQKAQMTAKDSMIDICFRQLEAMMQSTSGTTLELTQHRTPPDRGNALLVFLFFFC